MIKVRIHYEASSPKAAVTVEGYAPKAPRIGEDFSYYLPTYSTKDAISLGKVYNIEFYGDLQLVQTEEVVCEVWMDRNPVPEQAPGVILPFKRRFSMDKSETRSL